jgi:hypothetical protein
MIRTCLLLRLKMQGKSCILCVHKHMHSPIQMGLLSIITLTSALHLFFPLNSTKNYLKVTTLQFSNSPSEPFPLKRKNSSDGLIDFFVKISYKKKIFFFLINVKINANKIHEEKKNCHMWLLI